MPVLPRLKPLPPQPTDSQLQTLKLQTVKAQKLFNQFSKEIGKHCQTWPTVKLDLSRLDYFFCPASTKYHLSVRSGLLIHSVSVTSMMLQVAKARELDIPRWKILIAGLLHDIGKCGLLDFHDWSIQPRYVEKNIEDGGGYAYSDYRPHFTLRDLSGLYAAHWRLPWDVIQAVMLDDGLYVDSNKEYAHKMSPLALLVQTADTFVGQLEETRLGTVSVDLR